jgi:ribosome-binding factor A
MKEESIKQKKAASLVKEILSDIFLRDGVSQSSGGMVTISSVAMSPDLSQAKIYLSFFSVKNKSKTLEQIQLHHAEWRHKLGRRLRNQVRQIPELHFYADETLDQVFRLEELFKEIKKEK